jgi:hypothetical protein
VPGAIGTAAAPVTTNPGDLPPVIESTRSNIGPAGIAGTTPPPIGWPAATPPVGTCMRW